MVVWLQLCLLIRREGDGNTLYGVSVFNPDTKDLSTGHLPQCGVFNGWMGDGEVRRENGGKGVGHSTGIERQGLHPGSTVVEEERGQTLRSEFELPASTGSVSSICSTANVPVRTQLTTTCFEHTQPRSFKPNEHAGNRNLPEG